MSNLSKRTQKLVKSLTVLTAVATVLSLSGVMYLAPDWANAATPADYGLREGDVVSAAGSDDPDVYIVNEQGYKRLFLNPVIFGFYGHLGGFSAVKNVSPATRDAFPTSGLFRVDGDTKVYGVESTGEDTGILHWVNTTGAQAVADDPNFFKKVFVINQNEFNWYTKGSDYTSVNQVPNYSRTPGSTPTPVGPLSVSLAPGNPAATTLTKNATGAEFLRVRVSGTGTVNTLTVKRLGAGEVNDFSNVYVYDGARRLVSGKTFSSSSGEATFLLNLAVSGSKDLSIVADMDNTNNTAGNVNYIQLVGMTATGGATVSGTPLNGNNMTSSGATSGRLDVAVSGSLSNPNVGARGAQISEFKLTANTEAASVKRLTMINSGSVKPADMTNLQLKTGAMTWSGTMTSDGYAVFDLGSGYTIAKGGNAIFKMYADLAGKKDETVDMYFESAADLYAVGDQYGQGMNTASGTTNQGIDALDTAAEATTLTLQGGVLTISFVGPTATNIATNATDVTLLRYSMIAASNIEVRKTEFTLCGDNAGDGYEDVDDETTWDDLTDFKVWNESTNTVVMGPKDGTAFDFADDGSSCPSPGSGAQEQFTDVLDLMAGQTYNFKVTADFDTSLGGFLDSTDKVRVVLDDYSDDAADVTVMKYSGTNTAVAAADIVPRADISGPDVTLQGSSLTLGLASNPADRTYIKGTTNVDLVGITFQAALGSGLKVTDVKLTGYAEDETGEAHDEGVAPDEDTGVTVSNAISNLKIYEAESGTLLSSSPTENQLSVSGTGTIKFAGLNWQIPAGATRTLLVRGDLSTNTASGTNGDRYAFDIGATGNVTALDDSNNTVNAGNATPNGGTSPTVDILVKNSGNLTVAAAPSTPAISPVYWGQTGAEFSKFRFTATDEGQYLERINFNTGDTAGDLTANINNAYLTYKNKAGNTLTATGAFNTAGSVSFAFTGDNRPYVPADSSLDVTVKADMKTKAQGATNAVNFSIDLSGGNADEFRAVGESGTVMDGSDSDIVNTTANNMYVYRVYPKFTNLSASSGGNAIGGNKEIMRFTIEAIGLPDSKLFFDGGVTNSSGSILFDVVASGQTNANMTLTFLGADDGLTYGTDLLTTAQSGVDFVASLSFGTAGTGRDLEISGGSSKTIYVTTTFANFATNGDNFQMVLRDEAGQVNWVANSDVNDAGTANVVNVLKTLPLNGTSFVTTGL